MRASQIHVVCLAGPVRSRTSRPQRIPGPLPLSEAIQAGPRPILKIFQQSVVTCSQPASARHCPRQRVADAQERLHSGPHRRLFRLFGELGEEQKSHSRPPTIWNPPCRRPRIFLIGAPHSGRFWELFVSSFRPTSPVSSPLKLLKARNSENTDGRLEIESTGQDPGSTATLLLGLVC